MTGIALAALLQVSLAVSDTPTTATLYEQAVKRSIESGKPVLVLVGADWCHYCKIVQRDVLPVLKERGLMDKVEYVYLDHDRDRDLVGRTLRGEIIPEMVMYRKTAEGWKRTDLSGGYKVEEIEGFIKGTLKEADAAAGKKPEAQPAQAEKTSGDAK